MESNITENARSLCAGMPVLPRCPTTIPHEPAGITCGGNQSAPAGYLGEEPRSEHVQ